MQKDSMAVFTGVNGSENRVGGCREAWHIAEMKPYDRIGAVIRYLEEKRLDQPDLDTLARVAGLSPLSFHRLFFDWAGTAPEKFLEYLSASHAKVLLKDGNSVLDAVLESGVSGPGRLHEFCVNLDAASPGEIRSAGAGWRIRAGFAASPFGTCLIAGCPRGICHLSFVEEGGEDAAWNGLVAEWPNAGFVRNEEWAGECCGLIFARSHCEGQTMGMRARPFQLFVKGTAFQVKVWRALLQVPEGRLVSYGKLAELAGNPNASRAVGTAVGHNPVGYLIPCHRVIRESGAIGGYMWGTDRKRAIQAWEYSGQPPRCTKTCSGMCFMPPCGQ